jgi:hypothetical protein
MTKDESYQAYGLTIASELHIPDLQPGSEVPDVSIRYGMVTGSLPDAASMDICCEASSRQFLMRLDAIGSYLVSDGHAVLIDPAPGADATDLRTFLCGPVWGALLQQRGLLVLHGSAVARNGRAIVFAGASGTGKSTLAAACCRRGDFLLTDKLCAISFSSAGAPEVLPAFPVVHLWADALMRLGIDASALPRQRPHLEKYGWRLSEQFSPKPAPLEQIYLLGMRNLKQHEVVEINGSVRKLDALRKVFYRHEHLVDPKVRADYFIQSAYLARNIEMKQLNWPRDTFSATDLISFVSEELDQ